LPCSTSWASGGFALVGASYGGYVALQVASAVPDRVERLVLVDAAADLIEPDESLREVWRQEQSLVEIGDLAGATDLMVDTWLGPDADDDHRALLRDMQRRAFDLQVAAGDQGANRDLPVDLARITASVTVVVGHHDLSFSGPRPASWRMDSRTPTWSNSPGPGTCRRWSARLRRLAWWPRPWDESVAADRIAAERVSGKS
jgi:pimeloyl-ACP methyl ester carboxylesterase